MNPYKRKRARKLVIRVPTSSMQVETALRLEHPMPTPQAALLEAKSFPMGVSTQEAVAEALAKGAVAYRTSLDKEEGREEALHKGAHQPILAKPDRVKAKGRGVAELLEQGGRAPGAAAEVRL